MGQFYSQNGMWAVIKMQLNDALIESQHCLDRFGKVPEMKNAVKEISFVDLLDEVGSASL